MRAGMFVLAIFPANLSAEALNNRSWARAITDDLSGAQKDCSEALRLRPRYADAYDSRGLVQLKRGSFKDAIIDYDTALGINPNQASRFMAAGLRNGARAIAPAAIAISTQPSTFSPISSTSSSGMPSAECEAAQRGGRVTMAAHTGKRRFGTVCALLGAALACAAATGSARAGELNEEQIVKALTPANISRITRSFTLSSPAEAARKEGEDRFIKSVRNRVARSLTMDEREKIAAITETKQERIDLEINFDYGSAVINAHARPIAVKLGNALSRPEFKDRVFVIADHTDAKGSSPFNQDLSERRAEAIKRFLVENGHIEPSQLVTVGYGKTKLKDVQHPFSSENRRVQVVNVADK
jgi:outer membrane protein OmpA-like peptidoglycan-associated protein